MKKVDNNQITRKEALKKMGTYPAVTSLGTFIILNPQKVQANSAGSPGSGGLPET